MSREPSRRLASGVATGEAYGRLHQTIFLISTVILGLLVFFSMVVMPFFVIRFGWGYKP